jgi:hypothetical protein
VGDFNFWIFALFCYLAVGALVCMHVSGVMKYYHRQTPRGYEPMFGALLVCIALWPVVLAQKDVG